MFGQMFTKSDNVLKSYLTHECYCDICDNIDTCSYDFWTGNENKKSRILFANKFFVLLVCEKKNTSMPEH